VNVRLESRGSSQTLMTMHTLLPPGSSIGTPAAG
jgi:hypothetical protein